MLAFWRFDLFKNWKKSSQCFTKWLWFSKMFLSVAATNVRWTYRTCCKQIRWPHTSNILDGVFHCIFAAHFWLQNFNKNLIKALEYHTHLLQQCFWSIFEQSNPSKTKHYLVWATEKCLLNFTFLVSTNAIWFHSYLRTPSGYHRMDKNCCNSHCQKNSFCKSGSVAKFPRNVFLFHSENIGISNWQLRSSIKSNS